MWVPGYCECEGNVTVNGLAKKRAECRLSEPEPFRGLAKTRTRTHFQQWETKQETLHCAGIPKLGQSKKFISFSVAKAIFLLDLSKSGLSIIKKKKMVKVDNDKCLFWSEHREIEVHIMCHDSDIPASSRSIS